MYLDGKELANGSTETEKAFWLLSHLPRANDKYISSMDGGGVKQRREFMLLPFLPG